MSFFTKAHGVSVERKGHQGGLQRVTWSKNNESKNNKLPNIGLYVRVCALASLFCLDHQAHTHTIAIHTFAYAMHIVRQQFSHMWQHN